MTDWKMTRSETIKFINIYRNNECLWNFKSPIYKRNDLKNKSWANISSEFQKTIEEVKKKAKSLRTAYVAEKKKVENCKRSGTSSEVYQPNLFYYDEFKFLDSSIILRQRITNRTQADLSISDVDGDVYFTEHEALNNSSISCDNYEPAKDVLEECRSQKLFGDENIKQKPDKRAKSQKSAASASKYDDAVAKIVTSMNATEEEDVFLAFGRSIALQLKQLNKEEAIKAMGEIQTVVTNHALKVVRSQPIIISNRVIRTNSSSSDFSNAYTSSLESPIYMSSERDLLQSALSDADINFDT